MYGVSLAVSVACLETGWWPGLAIWHKRKVPCSSHGVAAWTDMLLRFSKCFFFQWSSSFPTQHLLLWNQNMETGWGENLCPFRQHKAFCILNLETRAQLEMRQSTTPSPASQHSFLCNASTKMVEGINYLWMAAWWPEVEHWTQNSRYNIYAKTGRCQTICQSMFSNCTCVWVFTGSVPPTFMTGPILLRAPVSPFYEGVVWCTQTAITLFLKDSRFKTPMVSSLFTQKNQEDLFCRINPNITRNITKTKAFLTFQTQNTTTSRLCGCFSSILAILTHPVHLPGWHNCRTNRLAPTGKCSISPRRKVLGLRSRQDELQFGIEIVQMVCLLMFFLCLLMVLDE